MENKMTTHIVSFSGGRSSRRLVHLMEEKRKAEGIKVEYLFMDTGAEHPKTYEFIKSVVKYYGIDLTCLQPVFGERGQGTTFKVVSIDDIGYNLKFWADMCAKYSTPYNPSGTFCTDQMKGIPSRAYYKFKYPDGNYQQWWGIRADEPRRLNPKKGVRYLAELCDFDKEEGLLWAEEQEVDLDIENADVIGNCVFCIKRGSNKVALAARLEPKLALDFIKMVNLPTVRIIEPKFYTDEFGDTIPKGRTKTPDIMYRGNQSLESIIENTNHMSLDNLKSAANVRYKSDATQCSESCEAINAKEFNMDLFK